MNVTNRTILNSCPLAETVLGSWYFNSILLLECTFGIVAAVENLVLLAAVCRLTVYHWNLRAVLGHLSFCLTWFALGHGYNAGHLLYASVCGQAMTARGCKLQELFISAMPSALTVYTLVSLCFERLYAALRYRTYDYAKAQRPWLAVGGLALSWLISLLATINPLVNIPANKTVELCESTLSADGWAIGTSIIVSACAELTAACLIAVAFFYTRSVKSKIDRDQHSSYDLSSRFQINQNVQLDATIIPSIGLHLLCHVPNLIFLLLVFIRIPLAYESKVLLLHVSYLWRIGYCTAHPLVAFYSNAYLRRRLRRGLLGRVFQKLCCRRFNSVDDQGKTVYFVGDGKTVTMFAANRTSYETNAHFNQLAGMWATAAARAERDVGAP